MNKGSRESHDRRLGRPRILRRRRAMSERDGGTRILTALAGGTHLRVVNS
jgi:hypothetical protein